MGCREPGSRGDSQQRVCRYQVYHRRSRGVHGRLRYQNHRQRLCALRRRDNRRQARLLPPDERVPADIGNVTHNAGDASLGTTRPHEADAPAAEDPQPVDVGSQAYLDVPTDVPVGTAVRLRGGIIGHEAPASLCIVLSSPMGESYALPTDYTYTFREEGVWTARLTLPDAPLVERQIRVRPVRAAGMAAGAYAVAGGLLLLGFLAFHRERKKGQKRREKSEARHQTTLSSISLKSKTLEGREMPKGL